MKGFISVLAIFGAVLMAGDGPTSLPAPNSLRHVDSGQDVSLASLHADQALVILYYDGLNQSFVSCDANDTVQSLEKAHGDHYRFVTVIAETPERADAWRKRFDGMLVGEFYNDPHGVIAKHFHLATHGVLMINQKGQLKAVMPNLIPRKELLKPLHRAINDL